MQAHHRSSAILIAVLMVPFGVAIYQDAGAEHRAMASSGSLASLYGESDYDNNYPPIDEHIYIDESHDALEAYAAAQELYLDDEVAPVPSSMGASFFDEFFLDGGKASAPALIGPLAGLAFDLSEQELLSLKPAISEWVHGLPDYPEAVVDLRFDRGTLASLTFGFPDDGSAVRSLSTQWGAPVELVDGSTTVRLWHNSKTRVRAALVSQPYDDQVSLTLAPYQDLADFVAPRARLFGFEDTDLLSLSEAEIGRLQESNLYPSANQISFEELVLADSLGAPQITLLHEAGRVSSMQIDLRLSPDGSQQLYELLVKKLGKATESGDQWARSYTFHHKSRTVVLNRSDGDWNTIVVTRK